MVSDSLLEQAESGDAESQYRLGLNLVYAAGGHAKDPEGAVEWFSRSADQGYLPAKRELGILLASGEGAAQDLDRAVALLSEAADALDPSAMYHLGIMTEKGIGVRADLQMAMRLLAYAAEMGYPGADMDAERIDSLLAEERGRRLRSRPLLRLQLSDVDVEAACCKKMLDSLLSQDIVYVDTINGPALLGEDGDGMDAVFTECPFCGAKVQMIPRDTEF